MGHNRTHTNMRCVVVYGQLLEQLFVVFLIMLLYAYCTLLVICTDENTSKLKID